MSSVKRPGTAMLAVASVMVVALGLLAGTFNSINSKIDNKKQDITQEIAKIQEEKAQASIISTTEKVFGDSLESIKYNSVETPENK